MLVSIINIKILLLLLDMFLRTGGGRQEYSFAKDFLQTGDGRQEYSFYRISLLGGE